MTGPISVVSTSCVMFFGSYVAALIPALLPLNNPKNIRLINASGAGLLLGAALCVVLPEGFVTFLEAQEHLQQGQQQYPEWLLGLALLLGFITMLGLQALADQQGAAEVACVDLAEQQQLLPGSVPGAEVTAKPSQVPVKAAWSAADQALLGLVIHAAADGLAVGAAFLSDSLALTLSVAVAILVHKFPVAFGLSSYLRGAGWYGRRLQNGILSFCAAAPVAALVSYLLFSRIAVMTDARNVALCVLFSGGTVLHAGLVHVLPSCLSGHGAPHASGRDADCASPKGTSAGCQGMHCGQEGEKGMQDRSRIVAVVVLSSFLPLFISALVPEAD